MEACEELEHIHNENQQSVQWLLYENDLQGFFGLIAMLKVLFCN